MGSSTFLWNATAEIPTLTTNSLTILPNKRKIRNMENIETDAKTIDLADLTHVLAKLDIYVPGLSYDETAQKIFNALPTPNQKYFS